jgi:trk system potassium uptake protein TrkA
MRVVIVGCGRLGSALALRMDRAGHDVTVVDASGAAFQNLLPDYHGKTLQGNILSRDVLERAGVPEADGFAAVTNSDTLNAVAAQVARTEFRVSNVVVRNYAAGWLPLHEAFGFPVVSSTTWGAQRLEALILHRDVRAVCSAGNGEVEVYEARVPEPWSGRPVSDLVPADACRAVAVTRAGRALLVSDGLVLKAGDALLVGATRDGLARLLERLAGAEGRPPGAATEKRCS